MRRIPSSGQWRPRHLKLKLTWWNRFRGGSRWETGVLPNGGKSFDLTIALRPNVHSLLNWYWCLEVEA